MDFYKITRVKDEDAKKAFEFVFPNFFYERRRLTSIAFHLKSEIEISNLSEDRLVVVIGSYFVEKFGIFLQDGNRGFPIFWDFASEDYEKMERMANSTYVSKDEFKFLMDFDPRSIRYKLSGCGIVSDLLVKNAFSKGQKLDVVLGYLFDISDLPTAQILGRLSKLKNILEVMKSTWEKRLNWFDNADKLKAARYYSMEIIKDVPSAQIAMIAQGNSKIPLMPATESFVDLEIFFYDQGYPNVFKEFVYGKITGLYNNRKSREKKEIKDKKKSCSFILTKEAENLIKEISQKNELKGSDFLNKLFKEENKEFLINILRRRQNWI